jgi:hypothetical protein
MIAVKLGSFMRGYVATVYGMVRNWGTVAGRRASWAVMRRAEWARYILGVRGQSGMLLAVVLIK